MEIKIVLALLILYLLHVYSQVGIDSSAPKITLDGVVKPTQSVALNRIITPKITGAQLKTKTYNSAGKGAFVCATDADIVLSDQIVKYNFLRI